MIEFISIEERNQLLVEFNDTKVDYPVNKTIIDLFEEQVERTPHNIALVFKDLQLTFKDLNEKSNQLAAYLRENFAIFSNDLVGLNLDRSDRMIIAILGVLKSGGAYVPIDVNYPQERISYIESDSNCKIVLNEEEMNKFENVQQNYLKVNPVKTNQPNDLAYVIYTSGTTGNPKGVMVEHRNIAGFCFNILNKFIDAKTE